MAGLKRGMARLRAEYETIAPPPALAERLTALTAAAPTGGGPARDPARGKNPKARFRVWVRRAAGCAAAAAVALVVTVNSSAAAAQAFGGVPGLGAVVKIVTFRSYRDETPAGNAEAQIGTPLVHGLADPALEEQLNQAFADDAQALITQYEADIAELGAQGHESVTSELGRVTATKRFLSVEVTTTIARGSAQQLVRWYTVDKEAGRLLALGDLFQPGADYVETVSAEIRRQMQEALALDPEAGYFLRSKEEPDGFWKIRPNQPFTITEDGALVICFDEAEAAAAAKGALEFTIPPQVLSGLLADGSPLQG